MQGDSASSETVDGKGVKAPGAAKGKTKLKKKSTQRGLTPARNGSHNSPKKTGMTPTYTPKRANVTT